MPFNQFKIDYHPEHKNSHSLFNSLVQILSHCLTALALSLCFYLNAFYYLSECSSHLRKCFSISNYSQFPGYEVVGIPNSLQKILLQRLFSDSILVFLYTGLLTKMGIIIFDNIINICNVFYPRKTNIFCVAQGMNLN